MRGRNHIIAGLGLLGIGRSLVLTGENTHWSVPSLPQQVEAVMPAFVHTWLNDGLGALSERVAEFSTWVHQLFISGDQTGWGITLVGLPLFVLGALLADVDLPYSTLGRFMPWGVAWRRGIDQTFDAQLPIAHRGWTHAVWSLIVVGVFVVFSPVWVWLLAGMVTHVLLDAMSAAGWVWYYPLFPSTWKIIERGDTRIVVSTKRRNPVGDAVRYSSNKQWLEHVYVWGIVVVSMVLTWKIGLPLGLGL